MKITVVYKNEKIEYCADKRTKLSDILTSIGCDISMPCGGIGKCGKCLIKAKGSLSPMSTQEQSLLDKQKVQEGYRLACLTYAMGNCEITIPDSEDFEGITDFDISLGKNPLTGNRQCYAAVIDIGTTTVAFYLYKMPNGELVKTSVHRNNQSVFGADVVSRITYAEKNGTEQLKKTIREQIDHEFESFDINPDFSVITGNTAMLHFYCGLPVHTLAKAPFVVDEYFGYVRNNICIPRCISAFVGADITCGIISSGLMNYDRAMLIDIGTNGEIVLKNGDEFTCCSAAAGPAFEGSEISNGTGAVSGAINSVYNVGNTFYFKTIDNAKPCGICGSGLIDAVASMLKADLIDKTGYLEDNFYIGDSGIFITPNDIRSIQTAKAAIRAAIETLCPDLSSVEQFFISGSFGNYLNVDNAILSGLLPREMKGKVTLCGNSSAFGAAMMLFDRDNFEKGNKTASQTKTIQLASNDTFYEKYIRYMSF